MSESELENWLGGPLSSFSAVYIFDGEESADFASGCNDLWRQRHNPFLGRNAPPTFSQGWKAWHALMFDELDTRETENASKIMFITATFEHPISVGVVCVIERDFSTASAYLRTMAIELQLCEDDMFEYGFKQNEFSFHGFCNSADEGFNHEDTQHEYAAFLMKLAPNTYSASAPFTCCDGHRIISYLSANVEHPTLSTEYTRDFYRPLQDLSLCCSHLTFNEIEEGWMYKQVLYSPGLRHLSQSVKRMQDYPWPSEKTRKNVVLKMEHCRLDMPFLFSMVDQSTLHEFFASPRCIARLRKAWCNWFRHKPHVQIKFVPAITFWRKRVKTVFKILLTIVPYALRAALPRELFGGGRPNTGLALYNTTLEACRAETLTTARNVVSEVMLSKVGVGVDFVFQTVCEFAGLDIFDTDDIVADCLHGWSNPDYYSIGDLFISNFKRIQKSGLLTARDPVLTAGVESLSRLLQTGLTAEDAAKLVFCAKLLEAGANPFAILEDLEELGSATELYERVFSILCFILHRWARTSKVFFGTSQENLSYLCKILKHRSVDRETKPAQFLETDKMFRHAAVKVSGLTTVTRFSMESCLLEALDGIRPLRIRGEDKMSSTRKRPRV